MRKTSLLLLATVALLAGCIGAPRQILESTPAPPAPMEEWHTVSHHFQGAVDLQIHGTAPGMTANGTVHEFWVNSTARAVDATLTWTSTGNVSDLDLIVQSPAGRRGCNLWAHPDGFAQCLGGPTTGQPVPGHYADLGGRTGAPDQPSRVHLDNATLTKERCPESGCFWSVQAFTKGVVAQATLTYRIDVLYPGPEPEASDHFGKAE
jgi:hypothetical protein